jgi:hypothetical protein
VRQFKMLISMLCGVLGTSWHHSFFAPAGTPGCHRLLLQAAKTAYCPPPSQHINRDDCLVAQVLIAVVKPNRFVDGMVSVGND